MEFYHDLGDVVPPITGWHVRVKVLRAFRVLLDPPFKRLGFVFSNEQVSFFIYMSHINIKKFLCNNSSISYVLLSGCEN